MGPSPVEKEKEERTITMKIIFQSLASGSSGNCYYLGTETEGILIDAGIGVRTIKKCLKDLALSFEHIRGILITHDHADHIKSVATLADKCNIPVFATPDTYRGINSNRCIKEKLNPHNVRYVEKEKPFRLQDLKRPGIVSVDFSEVCSEAVTAPRQMSLFSSPVDEFRITAFEVPHDAMDNVGYKIETPHGIFCFLTDMGHITERAASYITQAEYLIIEANYDEEMLRMGPYPAYLKHRIQSGNGHMSNSATAQHLADNLAAHLKQIWLCHLSKDNNHPELAFKTFEFTFRSRGIIIGKDVQLTVLKRTTPSDVFIINPAE